MNLALNRNLKRGGCQVLDLTENSVFQWLENIDTIIFGCDGVFWRHDEPIEGATNTFNAFRAFGKDAYICSNNSVLTALELCRKAQLMGCLVAEYEVLSSNRALARLMLDNRFKKKVYVIGGQGIVDELNQVGIETLPLDPSSVKKDEDIPLDPDVRAVVVGMDEDFNSMKLAMATCYLKDPQVMFVATNQDMSVPVAAPGRSIPGAGFMVAAVQAATQRNPFTCGKPNPYICGDLINLGIVLPERTLMIGDTLNTDIQFGYNCGFQTLLVGTGVDTYEDAIAAQASQRFEQVPDMYIPKLSDLLPFLSIRK